MCQAHVRGGNYDGRAAQRCWGCYAPNPDEKDLLRAWMLGTVLSAVGGVLSAMLPVSLPSEAGGCVRHLGLRASRLGSAGIN